MKLTPLYLLLLLLAAPMLRAADTALGSLPAATALSTNDVVYGLSGANSRKVPVGLIAQTVATSAVLNANFPSGIATNGATIVNATNPSAPLLLTAKTNTAAGKLVWVGPGTYATTNHGTLASNGVNWNFAPGSIVQHTGPASLPIFSDMTNLSGKVGSVAQSITVRGAWSGYYSNGLVNDVDGPEGVVWIGNPDSRFDIEAQTLNGGDAQISAIYQSNGVIKARTQLLIASNYPTLWWGGGDMWVTSDEIVNTSADATGAIVVRSDLSDTTSSNMYVRAGQVRGLNNSAVYLSANGGNDGGKNYRSWLDILFGTSTSGTAVGNEQGFLYGRFQKLASTKTNYATGSGAISISGATAPSWLVADKLSSAGSYGVLVTGSTNLFHLLEFEDTGNSAGFVGAGGGNTLVIFGRAKVSGTVTNAIGINHAGGTLRMAGGTMDMTAISAGTNGFPAQVSSSGLTLQGVTLLAPSGTSNSIYAATAQTVTLRGIVTGNKPVHPNVTLTGGLFVDTSSNTITFPSAMGMNTSGTNNFTGSLNDYGGTGLITNLSRLSMNRFNVTSNGAVSVGQHLTVTNGLYVGVGSGNYALLTNSAGNLDIMRDDGTVGGATHTLRIPLNGAAANSRFGWTMASAVITNSIIMRTNYTSVWPSAATLGVGGGALVVSNAASQAVLYWLTSTDGATTNAAKLAP